ncbi:unnamed protein product [Vitrella brassicaformis CCMP3155]|uniref:ERCC4 domain-containing protein n=2 Tax=Vitrella brassicaformis TaxID=1169539 RepID=A0A0G4EA08_VITBC|nr:unnamed protein product [Vitrella brassicaformis CCMP3155]|mmetsp:Transcript_16687/g.40058  ORF Transcript_16687/g.40058 Transcript_16687/m.40058 type:complete len:329 (+) Transcript_16687:116-1102(+)|eukprot:CEL92285.1 unnamed protein product [Vitrella brassicaformis CCMP3155]
MTAVSIALSPVLAGLPVGVALKTHIDSIKKEKDEAAKPSKSKKEILLSAYVAADGHKAGRVFMESPAVLLEVGFRYRTHRQVFTEPCDDDQDVMMGTQDTPAASQASVSPLGEDTMDDDAAPSPPDGPLSPVVAIYCLDPDDQRMPHTAMEERARSEVMALHEALTTDGVRVLCMTRELRGINLDDFVCDLLVDAGVDTVHARDTNDAVTYVVKCAKALVKSREDERRSFFWSKSEKKTSQGPKEAWINQLTTFNQVSVPRAQSMQKTFATPWDLMEHLHRHGKEAAVNKLAATRLNEGNKSTVGQALASKVAGLYDPSLTGTEGCDP